MAKVTGPLMSMDASGQLGKALVFAKWKGQNYVRQYVIPMNPNTADQAAIRDIVAQASVAWKNSATVGATPVNAAYKLAYNEAAAGSGMSGFNLFIKESIALNGGIAFTGTLEVPTVPGDVTPGA
jgi:hypothetical protein